MATEDRPIDRKANTNGVDEDGPASNQQDDRGEDLRPDMEHFSNFRESTAGFRDRLPDLWVPSIPAVAVVMAALYAFVAVGALSVGYGATSLAAAYGGTHAAYIVGGTFVFAYGYIGLRFVEAATKPDVIQP